MNSNEESISNYYNIPVVAYIHYIPTNTDIVYSYQIFPDAVCTITINNLAQTFKIVSADMGVIIRCLKNIVDNLFDNLPITEVVVTNQLIDFSDIRKDDLENTENIEKLFIDIFDTMLIAITKQCNNSGITHEYTIFKHTINLYKDFCFNVVKQTLIVNYPEIGLLDNSISFLIHNVVLMMKKKLSNMLIELLKKDGENIIKMKSFQPTTFTDIYYVDNMNRLKVAKRKNADIHYCINVKTNLCSCPDFKYRKLQYGLSCKHLLELKNKTRFIGLIKQIPGLYNIDIPIKEMMKVAYCPDVEY
jgi:predicted nucleic acid-binding Zn finger protein